MTLLNNLFKKDGQSTLRFKTLILLVVVLIVVCGTIINELTKSSNRKDAVINGARKLIHAKTSDEVKAILAGVKQGVLNNKPLFGWSKSRADDYCENIEELWDGVDDDTPLPVAELIDYINDMADYERECAE